MFPALKDFSWHVVRRFYSSQSNVEEVRRYITNQKENHHGCPFAMSSSLVEANGVNIRPISVIRGRLSPVPRALYSYS